jgi:predicted metal-binding protein
MSGPQAQACLVVCVTCKSEGHTLGAALYEALARRLTDETAIRVQPVECLSVCKRPCTIALMAPGKWSYVIGDIDERTHLEDIATGAGRYASSADGLVPWRERPLPFRRGVVSRTPPLPLPEV